MVLSFASIAWNLIVSVRARKQKSKRNKGIVLLDRLVRDLLRLAYLRLWEGGRSDGQQFGQVGRAAGQLAGQGGQAAGPAGGTPPEPLKFSMILELVRCAAFGRLPASLIRRHIVFAHTPDPPVSDLRLLASDLRLPYVAGTSRTIRSSSDVGLPRPSRLFVQKYK